MTESLIGAAEHIGRREQNKLDKQRRIVAAARDLFHRKGFDLTTTQEIAEQAGMGTGTLFLYVSTKEDLLILAFVDEMIEVAERTYTELDPKAPFIDQACQFMYGMLDYHAADVALAQHLIREVSVIRNRTRDFGIQNLPVGAALENITRRAQTAGEIRDDVPARDIMQLLFASHWDCLREWINGGLDMPATRARLKRMIRLQMAGLTPPKKPRTRSALSQ